MTTVVFTRRDFLRTLGAAGAALTIPACAASERTQGSLSAVDKPNFIVIFTDDQGYADVGCFGAKGFETPNIDRMAAEGARFTSFYSAAPVCTPARAALLTGCYPQRVSMPRVLFPRDNIGLNPDEITIADILKTRGYATCCIGKWHLGHLPQFLPTRQGFDYYFGIPYSNDMHPSVLMRDDSFVEAPVNQEGLTTRYTDEAISFIERMWPGRKQPITATPIFDAASTPDGSASISIRCATEGASIGYRVAGRPRWRIYTKPVLVAPGAALEAKAIRIGYKESETAHFERGQAQ